MADEESKSTGPPPTFENLLDSLEATVADLEDGDLGLDAAIKKYESGVACLRKCYALLEGAEQKIELLTGVDKDGNPQTVPLDDDAEVSQPTRRKTIKKRRKRPAQPRKADSDASDKEIDSSDTLF